MQTEYAIIYGIKKFEGAVSFYYPEVFIARCKNGVPQYLDKVGTDEVIKSYNLDIKINDHTKLIDLANTINPVYLENDLQKKKTRKLSLMQLFDADKTAKAVILKRIDFGLLKFMELIKKNKHNLYYQVERKIFLEEIKINFSNLALTPLVKFEKTVTGTNYMMTLQINDQVIIPKDHQIEIVTNLPCMVLNQYTLYEVDNIAGIKLQPFHKNEKVFIPNRITKQYFTTFIKDIIGTVDVIVEGFDYNILNPKMHAVIKFSKGFFEDNFEVQPHFYYDHVRFQYGDKSKYKVNIEVNSGDDISVSQINRDVAAEVNAIKTLTQYGFEATPAYRFVKKNESDLFATINSIIAIESDLKRHGWQIEFPEIDGRKLNVDKYSIQETINQNNDWFDIYATVLVGDQEIKFVSLLDTIRLGNRLFILPDHTCFIIPQEWMSKYSSIAKFCEIEDDKVLLKKAHFALLENLENIHTQKSYVVSEEDFDFKVPNQVHAQLRPYQIDGAKWLVKHYKNKLGACLADDMGLGKTLQTLTLLQFVKDEIASEIVVSDSKPNIQLSLFDTYTEKRKPLTSVIICPATLVYNWEREIKKFTPQLICTIHIGSQRSKNDKELKAFDIIITSYQTLLKDISLFKSIELQYVVLDEAHYIKNKDAQIFKAISELNTTNKISLSGTPIENSLSDLWSQMEFINPKILGEHHSFKKLYQDPIEKYQDQEAMEELKKILTPFILRRTKKEVLKDLPDMEEQIFLSEMLEDQKKLVETEKSKARNLLLSNEYDHKMKFHVFAAILRLRQLANHPKMIDTDSTIESGKYEDVVNTIETLTSSGNKLLLFSSFVSHLKLYEPYLKENQINYVKLTGEENAKQKKAAEEKFQNDLGCKIMLITVKAGGVGLNLTAANYVLILDPWWNPFPEDQAIARAHRMGQQNKVTVIRFISKGSIEEKILKLQEKKIDLVNNFMDFESMPELNDDLIMDLLD